MIWLNKLYRSRGAIKKFGTPGNRAAIRLSGAKLGASLPVVIGLVPVMKSATLQTIEMAGTSPAMTWRV
jgi:hypothetical protein